MNCLLLLVRIGTCLEIEIRWIFYEVYDHLTSYPPQLSEYRYRLRNNFIFDARFSCFGIQ